MKNITCYKQFYDDVIDTCTKGVVYKYTGLRPAHMMVNCENEYVQKALLNFMAEEFANKGVLDFSLAADRYLYYKFDGTMQNLKNTFSNIQSCAIGDNHYRFITGLDITRLLIHYGDEVSKEFFKKISDVAKYCTCVFYISSYQALNAERFIKKLSENVMNIKRITVPELTPSEVASIAIERMRTEFSINCTPAFEQAFSFHLEDGHTTNINDVFMISEKLLQMADFSTVPPILDSIVFEKFDPENRKEKINNEI